jgi:Tol biopolymer transport system component
MIQDGSEGGTQLVAGTHTPAWSLDNQWIAFGLDQDADTPLTFPTRLYRVQPDGNFLTPLTNNFQGVAAHPAWSPDGSLYYSLDNASAESDGIYHYNPDTNTHEILIPGSNMYPISVSPDGDFLLYQQDGDLNMWAFLEDTSYKVVTRQGEGQIDFAGWLAGKG